MPSHTAANALIMLYFLGEHPWDWPVWQEITGVKHGLFPEDDKLLPQGWSRENADDVLSYFKQFNERDGDDNKASFAKGAKGGAAVPGRKLWADFVSKNWKKWGVHNLIVESLRKHDAHPINIIIQSRDFDLWPKSDSLIPKALDSIGLALFGPECFGDGNSLLYNYHKPLTIFAQRSWAQIRVSLHRDQKHMAELEEKAMKAFKDLEEGKPTKRKIIATIQHVSKWRDIADIYGTPENVGKADDMLAEVNRIMEALGAQVPKCKPGSGKRLCKLDLKSLQGLATEDDIIELTRIYAEYFTFDADDDQPPLNSEDRLPFDLKEVTGGDLGMEAEAELDPDTLAHRLGFLRQRLPHQFLRLHHRTGVIAWNAPDLFKEVDPLPDFLDPLKLHWHQLAGVHSIARTVFTSTPSPDHCTGKLICDEVGLGKTALCITTIAFFNQLIVLQEKKEPLPPVLQGLPYFKGSKRIEALPHLIVTPGTLCAQWIHELKTLFLPKSVDIFVYDSSKAGNEQFWSPDGPFYTSKQAPQNKIIVTTHSALQREFQRCYTWPTGRSNAPWDQVRETRPTTGTLFQERYLSVTLDEAHEFRNLGAKHYAALSAFKRGLLRLVLTGTPLLTAPKDLSAIGRLVGVTHFFTHNSVDEGKADLAAFRRAKKLDDDGLSLRLAQIEAVRRIQKQFGNTVLRRTTDSRNWRGQTLLDLPPHKDIIGVLTLTEREREILDATAEAAKASVVSGNDNANGRFQTRKFYLEYRAAVSYAKESPEDPNPRFDNMSDWEPVKSTKMDVCAQICKHYLSRDDVPDVEFIDGKPQFGEPPLLVPGQPPTQTRRLLIFSEFPSMTPLLRNVLHLYGVDSLFIDGHMSYDKRDKVVAEFHKPKNPRVFIFSSVGSAGLNLAIADVVIYFDQPWSAQDERQIRGRAHRQPQKSIVKAIHLLANDSSDILMNDMARSKKEMFEHFVNKPGYGGEMLDLLRGKVYDDSNGDPNQDEQGKEEEERVGTKRRRVTKNSSKGKKAEKKAKKQAPEPVAASAPQEVSTGITTGADLEGQAADNGKVSGSSKEPSLGDDLMQVDQNVDRGVGVSSGTEGPNPEDDSRDTSTPGTDGKTLGHDPMDMSADASRRSEDQPMERSTTGTKGLTFDDSIGMSGDDTERNSLGDDSMGMSTDDDLIKDISGITEGRSSGDESMGVDDQELNGPMGTLQVSGETSEDDFYDYRNSRLGIDASPPVPPPDAGYDYDSESSGQESPVHKRPRQKSPVKSKPPTSLLPPGHAKDLRKQLLEMGRDKQPQNRRVLSETGSDSEEDERGIAKPSMPRLSSETSQRPISSTGELDAAAIKAASDPFLIHPRRSSPQNQIPRPTAAIREKSSRSTPTARQRTTQIPQFRKTNPFARATATVSQENAPMGAPTTPNGPGPVAIQDRKRNPFARATGVNVEAQVPGGAPAARGPPAKLKISKALVRPSQPISTGRDNGQGNSRKAQPAPPEHRQMGRLEDGELSPPSTLKAFIQKQRSNTLKKS